MIRNHFKIAWRNTWIHGRFTVWGMLGLSLGMAVFIVVLIYVNRERSYDRWDDQLARVYRVNTEGNWGDDHELTSFTPPALGWYMQAHLPEVALSTAFREMGEALVKTGEEPFYEHQAILADSNFFKVFPYPFRYGNADFALNRPDQAVLSRETAEKWYGPGDPTGKTLKIYDRTYTISGVFDKPAPSHLDIHVCLSASFDQSNWNARVFTHYVLLQPNTNLHKLQQKAEEAYIFNFALGQQANPHTKQEANEATISDSQDAETWLAEHMDIKNVRLHLEPVANIHLFPMTFGWRDAPSNHPVLDFEKGNHLPVSVFSVIGTLVLLLAAINYANIAIAIENTRAKDSGIRKIVGASKAQLVWRSLTGSFIQVSISWVGALVVSHLMIRYLNRNLALGLEPWNGITPLADIHLFGQLVFTVLVVTLLSGLYPAFIATRFRPIRLLSGEMHSGQRGRGIRNALVVFQFAIALLFIISLLIVRSQLGFMKHNDPGFDTEQVLRIDASRVDMDFFANLDERHALMNALRAMPEVKSVATSHFYPGKGSHAVQPARFGTVSDTLSVRANWVGLGYFETLGITIAQGRAFSGRLATDTIDAAIINETAASRMGLTEPVGTRLSALGAEYRIIGVAKDIHLAGYQQAIDPELYVIGTSPGMTSGRRQLLVRFQDGFAATQALDRIKALWLTVEKNGPMRYTWLQDDFAALMEKYGKLEHLIRLLSVFAMAIAAMGVFAISTFLMQLRTKEIGIRKVLGATVAGIVGLLSKDFVKLVCLAIVIASPIAWWAMNKWLDDFAYRIDIQWWMFAVAGMAAVAIALLTVGWQAIRAAVANPIDSLRDE